MAKNKNVSVTGSKLRNRIFHWPIAIAFLALFFTGMIIYVPPLSSLAEGGWTRLVHRASVILLFGTPLIYALIYRKAVIQWIKEAIFWNKKPVWPPTIHNIWRKLHKSLVVIGFALFGLTGMMMWFLKDIVPRGLFQWSLRAHDILFIFAGIVLLFHIALELDWWLWKRRNCRQCTRFSCIDICPTKAMKRRPDNTVEFQHDKCNSCGLCMEQCRWPSLYATSKRKGVAKSPGKP
ncbi:cytochrome b/b6 domain-containing protein [Chloroflexota bacterium]